MAHSTTPRTTYSDFTRRAIIQGSECPECSDALMYIGTYFCATCPWILPDEGATRKEQLAFELAYLLLMKQRGHKDRIDFDVFTR